MAAPALAASMADAAICVGVTGTAALREGVSAEPVTAQAIITLRCIIGPGKACYLIKIDWFLGGRGEIRTHEGARAPCRFSRPVP